MICEQACSANRPSTSESISATTRAPRNHVGPSFRSLLGVNSMQKAVIRNASRENPHSEPRLRRVPAVSRALAILRLLGRSEKPMGVNQIGRELSLIPSPCLHILRVLMAGELVGFDPHTKLYSLDVGVLTIARS